MEYTLEGEIQQQQVIWVFGLRWYALLEANARAQAQRISQQAGASSWVLSGQGMSSVGLSNQRLQKSALPTRVSAAAFFAQLFIEQKAAAIIRLPTGQYWFVAAQQGRVLVRGDHCFADLEHARELMGSVLADNPKMHCIHGHQEFLEWSAVLSMPSSAATLMTAALQRRKKVLPRFFWWLLAGGVILTAYYLWLYWAAAQVVPLSAKAAQPQPDPVQELFAQHPRSVLQSALEVVYQLPVHAQGWSLSEAQCQLQPHTQSWACEASYQRGSAAVDVETFVGQQGWQSYAQVVDLEQMRITLPATDWEDEAWPVTQPPTLFQFLGQLQKIKPAFSVMQYRHRQGLLSHWHDRSHIKLQGPLRSVFLLFDLPVHVQWYRLVLSVRADGQLGLGHSALDVVLEGAVNDAVIY